MLRSSHPLKRVVRAVFSLTSPRLRAVPVLSSEARRGRGDALSAYYTRAIVRRVVRRSRIGKFTSAATFQSYKRSVGAIQR
jgi:hypothetical protein